MRAFSLHQPESVAGATRLLREHGMRARPVGGGTDLVAGVMRDQVIGRGMPYPEHLVDITRLPDLCGISTGADGVTIGGATTLLEVAESSGLARSWPMLAAAAGRVASPEIRAIGTVGGNLHQRPRCWFFRNKDFDCIKKGGDICFAVKGDNRYNAILDGHACFIVHPSDLAAALVALDAEAEVASPDGERRISFDDYFIGPDRDLLRETVLGPDEILLRVRVPAPKPHTHQAWEKLNEKGLPTWDFAIASAAVTMTLESGVWQSGRVVMGGVAPTPYRADTVERVLAGTDVRSALPAATAELRRAARPMTQNRYKVDVAEHVLARALLAALDSEPVEVPA